MALDFRCDLEMVVRVDTRLIDSILVSVRDGRVGIDLVEDH